MTKSTIAYPLQPPAVNNDMEEIQDIPNHIVHAFQIHQENCTNSSSEDEDIDINYYERNFPVGSLFSFTLQSTSITLAPSDSSWDISINPASFHIGVGSQLILTSAVLDPSFQGKNGNLSLFVSTDVNPDYTCICPFISKNRPVHGVDVKVTGPALVQFALVNHYDDEDKMGDDDGNYHSVNIFGSVNLCEPDVQDVVLKAKEQFMMMNYVDDDDDGDEVVQPVDHSAEEEEIVSEEEEMREEEEEEEEEEAPKKPLSKKSKKEEAVPNSAKKRKLSSDAEDISSETAEPSSEPAKLTKKQRRKLAKQKEQELQKVVAKENNHEEKTNDGDGVEKRQRSLTRERMIKGGILVQDIIHGTGAAVRSGKKIQINYTGTFPDTDKVFDKNNSKGHPLTFRIGTGEVIKGLDRGLAGMKVGGERVITVPSKLAYGEKGSSKVPANANLCFAVKLLSVGK